LELFEEGLAELVEQDGFLILSGILREQRDEIETAMRKHGLEPIAFRQREDWVALLGKREFHANKKLN
jgi:ribosomal protein L11 methylase PrmA